MTDKIQAAPISRYTATAATSRAQSSASNTKAAAAANSAIASAASDTVQLTSDSLLMQEASAAAKAAPAIDAQRVADVKQSLRDGSYQINPQIIASKMMNTEWELARK